MRGDKFAGPWGGHFEHARGHRPGGGGPFGGFGPGFPFDLGGFGPGGRGRGGFGGGFGRGGRRPRGDVRAAVLVLLAEGPSNGYRIIGEVTRRSEGEWKPSPGSVYPTLQQLQDEGLVAADPDDPKQFTLTDEGRAHVEQEYGDAPPPWETLDGGPDRERAHEFRRQIGALAMTYRQIELSGRPGDVRRAGDVLEKARRELLAILAEDLRGTPEG
ncbi:PadR family transcriptional regulator [Kineococcus aurantiacus]|uniref:DNA-binding PadR family transcriptional regulator n=1 Tax=Kineococcus aurantiacus TaxID=37633 RepID=A0A7Y9DNH4_9ACTN|nr:helix-turn-helix transcriptional regulator [Kineococcus aurantiacus]NYD23875.1 DNA-binding PadR family transcriptional regulator [Kineococcus aurantiacus]